MMRNSNFTVILTLTIMLAFPAVSVTVFAQQYQPKPYQPGKDVVWVPTPEELIEAMLDMAKVTTEDYVIDLGSGDGRIVIAAAKRGVRALGVEYNPDMVELSKQNAEKEGVSGTANFVCADIFETDFSQATVLTMYLLTSLNMRLRPTILDMKPGTRVVTHAFTMEDWEADQTASVEGRTAYFWIVPAKVAGTWIWQTAAGNSELTLSQTFQKIEGSIMIDGGKLSLRNAKLEGDRISFSIGDDQATLREYSGRVNGDKIVGAIKASNGPEVRWEAIRHADR